MFERCIKKLTELYQNGGDLSAVSGWGPNAEAAPSISAGQQDKEGGHPEMMNRLDRMAVNLKEEVPLKQKPSTAINAEAGSDANSDITAKAVSEIAAGKSVSLR